MNRELLIELDCIPKGFFDTPADQLQQILSGPTLFHLPGHHQQPLFISVLLHGNETTGLTAVQTLLTEYQHKTLPRAVSIFVGNIDAASQKLRKLPGQPDYNRIWPGTELLECVETRMARQVVNVMAKRLPFASIDIHNNTGLNPNYACITRLDRQSRQLASLFSRQVVYFTRPCGVQPEAFARICPSVTLECGKPGQPYGIQHTVEFLHSCLYCQTIPDYPVTAHDINLLHSVALVKIRPSICFSYIWNDVDFQLNPDLEHMNFTEIPAGTEFGKVRKDIGMPLLVCNEAGVDVSDDYFQLKGQHLISRKSLIPSMLTLDEQIIRQDCLCYLMENYT